MTKLHGICASSGEAMGVLRFDEAPKKADFLCDLRGEEAKKRFLQAISTAHDQLLELAERTTKEIGTEEGEIFHVQGMLVSDPDFVEGVTDALERGETLAEAIRLGAEAVCAILAATQDDYLSRRTSDVRDVSERVLSILSGDEKLPENAEKAPESAEKPTILAAWDLTPSRTAMLDRRLIKGILTEEGSVMGHTAILCRTLGIPALVSVGKIDRTLGGKQVLLRADRKEAIIDPNEAEIAAFQAEMQEKEAEMLALSALRDAPDVTADGRKILLFANAASVEEVKMAMEVGAKGIGLFRSERLFLSSQKPPSEEEQVRLLSECLSVLDGKPLILRTLDIGADKVLPYLPSRKEENPALGIRGIRFSLMEKELLRTQLRAALRAAVHGTLWLMFPMITHVEQVRQAKEMLFSCEAELKSQHLPCRIPEKVGIMIETPASALEAGELASESDFFSIGSNDLAQYTYAVDRGDVELMALLPQTRQAVFKLIEMAVYAAREAGIWCGICGEMASDPTLTAQLLAMGVDELSVVPPALLQVRRALRNTQTNRKEKQPMSLFKRKPKETVLLSPVDGRFVPIESLSDEVFARKLLGEGFAVHPVSGRILAPASGVIGTISDAGHAVTILTNDGLDLLVHVGIDTVDLPRETFSVAVSAGQEVKVGDLLLTADLEAIKAAGLPPEVIVIVTSPERLESFLVECGECIGGQDVGATYEQK